MKYTCWTAVWLLAFKYHLLFPQHDNYGSFIVFLHLFISWNRCNLSQSLLILSSDDNEGGISEALSQIPWQGPGQDEARETPEEVPGWVENQADEIFRHAFNVRGEDEGGSSSKQDTVPCSKRQCKIKAMMLVDHLGSLKWVHAKGRFFSLVLYGDWHSIVSSVSFYFVWLNMGTVYLCLYCH